MNLRLAAWDTELTLTQNAKARTDDDGSMDEILALQQVRF